MLEIGSVASLLPLLVADCPGTGAEIDDEESSHAELALASGTHSFGTLANPGAGAPLEAQRRIWGALPRAAKEIKPCE